MDSEQRAGPQVCDNSPVDVVERIESVAYVVPLFRRHLDPSPDDWPFICGVLTS
jgi:hypothetical protein